MGIILYKTKSCSKCEEVAKKLKEKEIVFDTSYQIDILIEKGFRSVPVLRIDDRFLDYKGINEWLKTLSQK